MTHRERLLTILRGEQPDQVPPDGLERRVKMVGELVNEFGKYKLNRKTFPVPPSNGE